MDVHSPGNHQTMTKPGLSTKKSRPTANTLLGKYLGVFIDPVEGVEPVVIHLKPAEFQGKFTIQEPIRAIEEAQKGALDLALWFLKYTTGMEGR